MTQRDIDLFEIDFPKMRRNIESILINKERDYKVDEIINSAFIIMAEKKLSYSYESFKGICIGEIRKYQTTEGCYYNEEVDPRKIENAAEQQTCKCCQQILPIAMFFIHRKYPSGKIIYKRNCKTCENEKKQKRHKEKMAIDPSYAKNHKERGRQRSAAFYKTVQSNDRLKEWHSKRNRENSNKWNLANPEKVKINKQLYIQRIKAA